MGRPSARPVGWLEERLAELRVVRLSDQPDERRRWRCRCLDCGTEVLVHVSSPYRLTAKRGCRLCSYPERNQHVRLTAEEAQSAARRAGMRPLEPYPGTSRPWRCACLTCGTIATPRLGNMRQRGAACELCALFDEV